MPLIIRPETAADRESVYAVEAAAFGRPEEAELVQKLQQSGVKLISLVAMLDDQIVGHVLFSPVTIRDKNQEYTAVALGPIAVAPAQQKKGVGSALCRAGLAACQKAEYQLVFVLGHSDYYPRFGFKTAARYGLTCQFDAPEEAFMVVDLVHGALEHKLGTVYYHPLFSEV